MILLCFFNFILLIFSIFCIKQYSIGDCLQLVQVLSNRRMVLQKTIKWHVVLSFFFLLLCVPLSFVSTWQEWNWSQMCNPGGLSVFIARVKFSPNIFVIRLHWWTYSQWKKNKKNKGVSYAHLVQGWPTLWSSKYQSSFDNWSLNSDLFSARGLGVCVPIF